MLLNVLKKIHFNLSVTLNSDDDSVKYNEQNKPENQLKDINLSFTLTSKNNIQTKIEYDQQLESENKLQNINFNLSVVLNPKNENSQNKTYELQDIHFDLDFPYDQTKNQLTKNDIENLYNTVNQFILTTKNTSIQPTKTNQDLQNILNLGEQFILATENVVQKLFNKNET